MSDGTPSANQPVVFLSYSHADAAWKDRLLSHLGSLERRALLTVWQDGKIAGGDDWHADITAAMDAASLAIFLVSPAFLRSTFIQETEVPHLLARWEKRADGLRIYPILAEPCDWESAPYLKRLQIRPSSIKGLTPLSAGTPQEQEERLASLAKEIRLLLAGIRPAEAKKGPPLRPDDVSIARLPATGEHFLGRDDELTLLDGAWADDNTKVFSIIAWGGVGKSALVNEWLARMAHDHWRGAERVFAWTFYSQGTRDTAASADQFIAKALEWFGDPDPAAGSPWDKGERLARLVRRQRTLLLLDGLEPLQHPPHAAEPGRITDPALATLVRELALENPGLCVITTREPVADLAGTRRATTAQLDLAHLSCEAGVALLRELGVQGSDDELRQAVQDVRGHALTISLLGKYLVAAHGGDIRKRDEVRLHEADAEVQGSHAFKVMDAYEKWFLREGEKGRPLVAILRLLGLFDRPADAGCLAALRKHPPIPDLTEPVVDLTDAQWNLAVTRLASCGFVAAASSSPRTDNRQPTTFLDSHPLVREHFGEQVRTWFPAAWKEGHNRLYEYLKKTAPEYPDTLEEMTPLFAAVAHGCQAGRHKDAYEKVYRRRIRRGNELFHVMKLGSLSADLAIISSFFERPWTQPLPSFTEENKAWLLNQAGFDLHAMGQLADAVKPMRASLDARIAQNNGLEAAKVACNLSTLSLTLGEMAEAQYFARHSVDLADHSTDMFMRIVSRTALADGLHQAGQLDEAERLFCEAEAVQKEDQPEYPLLYSLQGYLYCDLLLTLTGFGPLICSVPAGPAAQSEIGNRKSAIDLCCKVQKRATQTLEWAMSVREASLLDIALNHLSLGRALLLEQVLTSHPTPLTSASDHLTDGVEGLRQSNNQDELPRGLLARAALRRVSSDLAGAGRDLAEAQELAERSGMKLFLTDGLIEEACQAIADRGMRIADWKSKACECVRKAKEIIEETGYHRRDPEIQLLEQVTNDS
jgi:tetratricopeptide (TPR) repeat protein